MTKATKMKRVTTMLQQKIAKPKNLFGLEVNLERCHEPNIDNLPFDKNAAQIVQKGHTSPLTQFETFWFSTFDLPRCLYLFPMSWPCIN